MDPLPGLEYSKGGKAQEESLLLIHDLKVSLSDEETFLDEALVTNQE